MPAVIARGARTRDGGKMRWLGGGVKVASPAGPSTAGGRGGLVPDTVVRGWMALTGGGYPLCARNPWCRPPFLTSSARAGREDPATAERTPTMHTSTPDFRRPRPSRLALPGLTALAVTLALPLAGWSPAQAASIRFDFTARVHDHFSGANSFGYSGGDLITGHVIVDDAIAPVAGGAGAPVVYPGAVQRFVIRGEGILNPHLAEGDVRLTDDAPEFAGAWHDGLSYRLLSTRSDPGVYQSDNRVLFASRLMAEPDDLVAGTAIDAIARVPDMTAISLDWYRETSVGGVQTYDFVQADLTALRATYDVAPVPVPAALPLFAAALAGLGGVGLWRRRRS